jgi:hypothetical protein
MKTVRAGVVVLALVMLAVPVLAHVPSFPVDNTSPERAVAVPDAVKSWSFYDTLGDRSAKYYRVSLATGERLQVSTFTPLADGLTPSLVIMSPSLNGTDGVPDGVTVPEGMGSVVVEGERPERATYEPFAPSANYHTASFQQLVESDTTFVIAVYDPEGRPGPAGVALGYSEEFSLAEYVTVPFDLVRTHLWEGQHPLVAVGPLLFTVLLGVRAVRTRQRGVSVRSPVHLALVGAGLLILGSGVNTLVQMALAMARTGTTFAALITAAYVVVPLVCGGWAVWTGVRDRDINIRTRSGLVVAGVLSLVTWAGFIVGPVLLVGVAMVPKRFLTD